MYKNLFRATLGLMGIMGTLAIGVVNADNEFIVHDTENGTITVYSQDYSYGITIQDKNLGATKVGTGCGKGDDDTCGYYFQWGNNHGNYVGANTGTLNELLEANVNDWVNKGYSGNNDKFIIFNNNNKKTYDYRSGVYYTNATDNSYVGESPYNNLWGGGSDNEEQENVVKGYNTVNHEATNVDNRQGPCGEGYHVPSAGEWQELMMLWCNANSDICSGNVIKTNTNERAWANYLYSKKIGTAFSNDLSLPLAGFRLYHNGSVDYQGNRALYWSSSPCSGSNTRYAWYLPLDSGYVAPSGTYDRAYGQSIRCFKNEYVKPSINKDIVIEATSTAADQTLKINKYFANAYTVDWGDGTTGNLTADTQHTYSTAGTYEIRLSLTGGADRWTFLYVTKPLVPKSGTTMIGVKITSMPSLSEGFGVNATNPENYYFLRFNADGAITELPDGSFDTSNITSTNNNFFNSFNWSGQLTSLPDGSFDISNIKTVGTNFFENFNKEGLLAELPEGSFDTSNITSIKEYFFYAFNSQGALTSLPDGSFKLSTGLTTVGNYFFILFNYKGALTSLPLGSFDTSNISGSVGSDFFYGFNQYGALESLPVGSFDISNITAAGNAFFRQFNVYGALKSLPEGSFDTSNITTIGNIAFRYFNGYGALESLPEGSFDISNIIAAGTGLFAYFNYSGSITTLPNSFTMNSVGASQVGGYNKAFNSMNYTINKKVSDLVSGITDPSSDMNTFSDNHPGRCGVHENWLVNAADACNVKYDANGGIGTITGGYMSNATGVVPGSGIDLPTREGFVLSGWLDASGNIVDEIIFPDMDGQTLYANWEANVYTITLDIDGTLTTITGSYGSPITPPANPIKNGYKFVGWEPEIPATMPAKDMTIKAKWEKNGSSGGGGGSNKSSSDVISNDSEKSTEQKDGDTGMDSSAEPQNDNQNAQDSQQGEQASAEASEGHTYTQEFQEAYEFAKGKGITTMPTIQKADMDGKLTRIAMAKMLSQYAMNVLGQKPASIITPKFNDVTEKMDSDYDDGVTLAYQLGIMGINMPNNKFRPNDEVTRGEFVTALSRMLYNTSDGEYRSTPKYYTHHMEKMEGEGIITNTDPNMKELRGYVMIMLMRSVK